MFSTMMTFSILLMLISITWFFYLLEDVLCDELNDVTTQKKVNEEVHRPSTSGLSALIYITIPSNTLKFTH